LRLSRDFTTFLDVRSALILEELTMGQRPSTPSTTLWHLVTSRLPVPPVDLHQAAPCQAAVVTRAPTPGTPRSALPLTDAASTAGRGPSCVVPRGSSSSAFRCATFHRQFRRG
jgi:hypothetical protein